MNEVEAVKTKEKIDQVENLLLKHGNQDFSDVFKLGINVAFRISDLLSLTYDELDLIAAQPTIIEGKTGKARTVRLNSAAIDILHRRRSTYPQDIYVFQSHSNRGKGAAQPLTRGSVARKFKEIGSIVGVALSTHSMRKTRGYMMYKGGVDIAQIAKVLNHSSPTTTLAYIGITKENTLQTYDDFVL